MPKTYIIEGIGDFKWTNEEDAYGYYWDYFDRNDVYIGDDCDGVGIKVYQNGNFHNLKKGDKVIIKGEEHPL